MTIQQVAHISSMLFSKFLLSLFSSAYTVPTFRSADLPLRLPIYANHNGLEIRVSLHGELTKGASHAALDETAH